jgi:aminodeoxyfutalosine deaminase
MFGTDLSAEYALAARLGVAAQAAYRAGLAGALCDEKTRARIVVASVATGAATGVR